MLQQNLNRQQENITFVRLINFGELLVERAIRPDQPSSLVCTVLNLSDTIKLSDLGVQYCCCENYFREDTSRHFPEDLAVKNLCPMTNMPHISGTIDSELNAMIPRLLKRQFKSLEGCVAWTYQPPRVGNLRTFYMRLRESLLRIRVLSAELILNEFSGRGECLS